MVKRAQHSPQQVIMLVEDGPGHLERAEVEGGY